MARVPEYGQRKVTPNTTQKQFFQANTSPDAHGAGIGRALNQVAQGINSFADGLAAQEALDDQATVNSTMNEFRDYVRERSYNPETGYFMAQGENAVTGRQEFYDDIDNKKQELRKNLSPKQQKVFDRSADSRANTAKDSGIRHSAQQRKHWYAKNSEATLNSLADDALGFAVEPDKFDDTIMEGARHIQDQGKLNGWPEAETQQRVGTWVSGVHSNMVKRLATEDAVAAKAWLDSNRARFTETDRVNLDTLLEKPVRKQQATSIADKIINGEAVEEPETFDHQGKKIQMVNPVYGEAEELNTKVQDREKFKGKVQDDDGEPVTQDEIPQRKVATEKLGGKSKMTDEVMVDRVLGRIIQYESGGNPSIKNRMGSSALGLGQIISSTWMGLVKKHNPGLLKGRTKAEVLALRTNGKLNAYMTRMYALDNIEAMRAAGVEPTPGRLYAAHQLGVGGLIKIAKNPNMSFAQLYGRNSKAYVQNPNLHNKTGASYLMWAERKFGGKEGEVTQYVGGQLNKIKDPKLRAEVQKQIVSRIDMDSKILRANQRRAKIEAEKWVIANPNTDPMSLPLDLQQQIGVDGMSTLSRFHELQGKVETDERLYLELIKEQAADPIKFAEEVDLFDHIDKLSVKDRRELGKLQAKAIKDQRENKDKALTESKSISSAMGIAKLRLEESGVIKKGKKRKPDDVKREAQFQRALIKRMEEFQKTQNRIPSDLEVSDMVDQLLTPIIIRDPGIFGKGEMDMFTDDALLFEAPWRKDNQTVELNVPYENIPIDVRSAIKTELRKELGKEPTEEQVIKEYIDFVLTGK